MAKKKKASHRPGDSREHLKPFASVPGRVACLKCQRIFASKDRLRNRLCPGCARTNLDTYVKTSVTIHHLGGLAPDAKDDY